MFLLAEFERSGGGVGLDYGCGDGLLVAEAVDAGHDFYGVEKYYDGWANWEERSRERTPASARDRVQLLGEGDTIPFPDGHFDFVCSNQVLEHVHDLELTVSELGRVTKPGGVQVHLFPSMEIVVEPHLGIPLYHRMPRRLRGVYARPFHRARRATASRKDPDWQSWFAGMNGFFEGAVRLRPRREVEAALAQHFDVEAVELEKLSFHRGRKIPQLAVLRAVEHRRAGVAIRAHLR